MGRDRRPAPPKRFRGKRRYFRRVLEAARAFGLEVSDNDWWDHWHYHADWPGWGNLSTSYRREHIRALAIVYNTIAATCASRATPFQAWLLISGRDAGEDATYLHTPNANQTPFPMYPVGVQWGVALPQSFAVKELNDRPLRIGRSQGRDEFAEPPRVTTSFFINSPEVGLPLEAEAVSSADPTFQPTGFAGG